MKLWDAESQIQLDSSWLLNMSFSTQKCTAVLSQLLAEIFPKDLPSGTEEWKEQQVVQYRSVADADRGLRAETRTSPHF